MPDAKLEFVKGRSEFRGEGSEGWLAEQLDKVLASMSQAVESDADSGEEKEADSAGSSPKAEAGREKKSVPLAAFLKEKNATVNQRRKFLATAIWLHDNRDQKRINTGDISKALAENSQSRLANASQSLNDNVKQGFAEKDGKSFYVTDEGRAELVG